MLINMRKRTAHEAVRDEAKRGFTLTEIAIVLGIVGLILGAIWVAAAAVYNNLRTSKGTTELLTVTQNVRALYATSGLVDPNANMAVGNKNLAGNALTYVQGGMFPNDTLNNVNPTLATSATDPWGGTISIQSAQDVNGVANDSFYVVFDQVPQQACISMLTSNVGQGRDPAMIGAGAGASGGLPGNAAPVANFATAVMVTNPATTAQTQCAAVQNAVGFAFKVKG